MSIPYNGKSQDHQRHTNKLKNTVKRCIKNEVWYINQLPVTKKKTAPTFKLICQIAAMDDSKLFNKNSLPENLKKEIQDFVEFFLTKTKDDIEKKPRRFGSMKGQIKMGENFTQRAQRITQRTQRNSFKNYNTANT